LCRHGVRGDDNGGDHTEGEGVEEYESNAPQARNEKRTPYRACRRRMKETGLLHATTVAQATSKQRTATALLRGVIVFVAALWLGTGD